MYARLCLTEREREREREREIKKKREIIKEKRTT